MSRRTAIVEDFDDDTDLPLPSRPLPNTGSRGPLLQEITSDDEDDEIPELSTPGPAEASPSQPQAQFRSPPSENRPSITDITPYKSYVLSTCFFK
jgi:signal recognition particle subunit SRP19